jgi:urease accessory protein
MKPATGSGLQAPGTSLGNPLPAARSLEPEANLNAVDSRSLSEIGRVARLDLVFACRRGRTVLAHAYAEPPFRVGRLLDAGAIAHLILVCNGPGVFTGDRLEQRVRIERGARVLLVSQAALQLHPAAAACAVPLGPSARVGPLGPEVQAGPLGPEVQAGPLGPEVQAGPASIDSWYEIDDDATLDCFWDPVIPFAGARLKQRIGLNVAAGGELFWSDALMSGRVGRGETWGFAALDHELRVNVAGSLTYLERYALAPSSRALTHTWSANRANYLGTTIVRSHAATVGRAEEAQLRLGTIDGLRAGVDCLDAHLIVGRLLAENGPPFVSGRAMLRDVFDRPALRRT